VAVAAEGGAARGARAGEEAGVGARP